MNLCIDGSGFDRITLGEWHHLAHALADAAAQLRPEEEHVIEVKGAIFHRTKGKS